MFLTVKIEVINRISFKRTNDRAIDDLVIFNKSELDQLCFCQFNQLRAGELP